MSTACDNPATLSVSLLSPRVGILTIPPVAGDFVAWLGGKHYSPATARLYLHYIARAERAGLDLATATTDNLTDWLETLPASRSSQAQGRKALIAWYRWAGIVPNPAEQIPSVPQEQRLPRPLSESDHLRWVLAARQLGGHHELAGLLMATTGARISEVRLARWQDVDLSAGTWRVRGKGANRQGPKWRVQPLHREMVDVLRRQVQTSEWLFPGRSGVVSDGTMRSWLIDIGYAAGLGRVTPHRIRHSTATLALVRCKDLRAVQQFLGHSSVQSTQIYTEVLPDRLREVVDSLPT